MITKKTEYAIRALAELGKNPDQMLTANQVAQRQNIPPKYLPQIVSELSQAGLLQSTRGYGGGIKLGSSPDSLTLLEIVEAVQGKLNLFECQLGEVNCVQRPTCELQGVYDRALEAMRKVLADTRLSDIHFNHR